jgi:hypothetical protein
MRFCPFCSAENADDLAVCQACGRRLPPLPPRRGTTRNAPPTGIQLPNRPAGSRTIPPPSNIPTTPGIAAIPAMPQTAQEPATTVDPHYAMSESTVVNTAPVEVEPVVPIAPISTLQSGPNMGAPTYAPSGASGPVGGALRDSAPELPPPPSPAVDDNRRQLANALNPSPAAQRREPSLDERIPADRRNREDSKQPLSPTSLMRPHSPSQPPANSTAIGRPQSPSQPPPIARPSQTGFGQPAAPANSTSVGRPHSPSQPPPFRRPSTIPPPTPRSGPQPQFGGDTFVSEVDPILGNDFSRSNITVEPTRARSETDPPPTRIRSEVDRPFSPAQVLPVPEIPEPGLVKAARYAYIFARARWQRRGAIRQLGIEIRQDTDALDQVLGALGLAARTARVEGRVFSAENSAISDAQERINVLNKDGAEVEGRRADELTKFVDIEKNRNAKLTEAERMVGEAQSELGNLEGQRRSLRDKRKELERRMKAYLKAADDHDRQAGTAPLGDQRQELRRVAEGHRKEAAALEPDRQEIDRRLGSIERPINEVSARLDAGKAELDAAKRSLNDAREGHTHRLAELDAEQKRKAREIGLAESEISRRLVTLGTLVNLNRIEDPQFGELYTRIDRLRGAITARTTEIEKLTAEREAYDRGTLVRGVATIGGAILILIALIVIVAAIL